MEGWSWVSLVGVEDGAWFEFPELGDVVSRAALEAEAPSLGFAVMDSDSAYLVGADTAGVRFHLVVNEDAFEDEPPEQDLREAAAWASDHAPRAPAADELREVLARRYLFAEDGLDVVFARMGILPPDAEQAVDDAEEDDGRLAAEAAAYVASLDDVADLAPDPRRPLEDERWYAAIRGFRGREDEVWWLLFAEGAFDPKTVAFGVQRAVARIVMRFTEDLTSRIAFVCRAGERVRMVDPFFEDRQELSRELSGPGFNLDVGDWQRVPDEVPRDLTATVAWLTARRDS